MDKSLVYEMEDEINIMKKHVFLILAHNNPEYLTRLVEMLDAANHFFFIHIDKKNEILLENPLMKRLNKKENCRIISRVTVNWGGFSQVQATLALIRESLESAQSFDWFHLISGCDLPLVSPLMLDEMIERQKFKGYVGLASSSNDLSKMKKLCLRYRIYHFNDFANRRKHNLKTMLCRVVEVLEKKISNIGLYLRPDINMPVYKGSQWWSLRRDVVDYIMFFLQENAWYQKRFLWTSCIDEIFFHTIIFNSKFADEIEKNNHRYVDWRKLRKNDKPPRVLTEEDIPLILAKNCWFARKTDPQKSSKLIKYFEEELKKNAQ